MFRLNAVDDTGARAGVLITRHGDIATPAFMPVATRAAVRTLDSEDITTTGTEMLISNAFLLHLRPGNEVISEAGGLHGLMNFNGAIFTDSGGFQMIRKGFLLRLSDDGIVLRSPYDGQRIKVRPEDVVEWMEYQRPDIGMMLDDLPPHGSDTERQRDSVRRTLLWAGRAKKKHDNREPGNEGVRLFGILQGGTDPVLRKKCIEGMVRLDFDGYGIGGLSIGETEVEMMEMVRLTTSLLPEEKPVYLMGVGSPVELLNSIGAGVDIFDSVFPARHARHKTVLTRHGAYSIKSPKNAGNFSPLEEGCGCPVCRRYTRAYIHHLVRTGEFGWMRLVTIHNLYFIQNLLSGARKAIERNEFREFKGNFIRDYTSSVTSSLPPTV